MWPFELNVDKGGFGVPEVKVKSKSSNSSACKHETTPFYHYFTDSSAYSSVTNSFLQPPPNDAISLPLKCSKTSIAP